MTSMEAVLSIPIIDVENAEPTPTMNTIPPAAAQTAAISMEGVVPGTYQSMPQQSIRHQPTVALGAPPAMTGGDHNTNQHPVPQGQAMTQPTLMPAENLQAAAQLQPPPLPVPAPMPQVQRTDHMAAQQQQPQAAMYQLEQLQYLVQQQLPQAPDTMQNCNWGNQQLGAAINMYPPTQTAVPAPQQVPMP